MARGVKESTVIVDQLYSRVEESMKTGSSALQRYISNYIDRNHRVLFAEGPTKRLYFQDDPDRAILMRSAGLDSASVRKALRESPEIWSGGKIMSNPFNTAAALVIRYYMLAKKQKEMEATVMYLALSFYSSIHYKYFKVAEPNENIMSYTINNLSNKFKIKQLGSLFKALHWTAMASHEKYAPGLKRGTDRDIRTYILSLKSRLDGLIQNIADEFYRNRDEGRYLNKEEDSYEEENYFETDNMSFVISRVSDAATLRMLTKGVDARLARLSANIAGISVAALRSAIVGIVDRKNREVKELFTLILQLYLMDGKHPAESIRSKDFIEFCLEIYIKSNTKDETIIRIKQLLDEWLEESSPNYVKTERAATKNNFRKAVMLYFVLLLQQSYTRA